MSRLAPEGAEWAGTCRTPTEQQVWYRHVGPNSYEFSYGQYEPWVAQQGSPIQVPLTPIADWLSYHEQQQKLLSLEACKLIESEVSKWNIDIDCSAAMRATVDAMIRAGYRK